MKLNTIDKAQIAMLQPKMLKYTFSVGPKGERIRQKQYCRFLLSILLNTLSTPHHQHRYYIKEEKKKGERE